MTAVVDAVKQVNLALRFLLELVAFGGTGLLGSDHRRKPGGADPVGCGAVAANRCVSDFVARELKEHRDRQE